MLPRTPIDAAVGFDNRAVGAAVARRFIAGGRRKLAFLGGSDVRSNLRFQGFRQAARRAGLVAPRYVTVPTHGSADAAAVVANELGNADAVFTASDVYAVGLLSALRAMCRQVPNDVAVFGLGDLEMSRHSIPRLSTVRIDGRRIGNTAAELALSPEHGRVVDVGFELLERETA
ncbi:MAG: substrate-binding domain-containing protein [Bradyrhizobium sp.]